LARAAVSPSPTNTPQAARGWYEKAVDAVNIDAMNNIGALLAETDPQAVGDWYEKAKEARSDRQE